jgi:hypothetical protein
MEIGREVAISYTISADVAVRCRRGTARQRSPERDRNQRTPVPDRSSRAVDAHRTGRARRRTSFRSRPPAATQAAGTAIARRGNALWPRRAHPCRTERRYPETGPALPRRRRSPQGPQRITAKTGQLLRPASMPRGVANRPPRRPRSPALGTVAVLEESVHRLSLSRLVICSRTSALWRCGWIWWASSLRRLRTRSDALSWASWTA